MVLLSFTIWRELPSTTHLAIICVMLGLIYWKLRQTLYLGAILGFVYLFYLATPWLLLQEYVETNRVQQLSVDILSVVIQATGTRRHTPTTLPVVSPIRHEKVAFTAKVNDPSSALYHQTVKLSWYYKQDDHKTPSLQVGDTWSLNVKLKPLHSFRNAGGFDYVRYLLGHKMVATGYVRQGDNHLLQRSVALRADVIAFVEQHYGHYPWVNALLFGQKVTYDENVRKQTLIATGTAHLFVISGLHVAIVFGSFLAVWKCCLLTLSRFTSSPNKVSWHNHFCLITSFLGVLGYAYMAGGTVPVLRATSVCALWVIVQILHIRIVSSQFLVLTILIILMVSPWASYQVGFWLSFGSVGCIMLIAWFLPSTPKGFIKKAIYTLKLQCLLSVLLIPMTWWFFGQVSMVSMVANLLMIPIFAVFVVPLHLVTLGVILVDFTLMTVFSSSLMDAFALNLVAGCNAVLNWNFYLLEWLYLPQLVFTEVRSVLVAWLMGGFFVVALMYIRYWRLVGGGVCILGLVSWYGVYQQNITTFTVLDVGQGSAAILHQNNAAVIFDVGDAFSSRFNTWNNVLYPYIKSHHITEITAVYISHADRDHVGSLAYLREAFPNTPIYRPLPKAAEIHDDKIYDCSTAQPSSTLFTNSQLAGVTLDILWPKDENHLPNLSKNNTSCVLSVTVGKNKILLPGDIEFTAENALLMNYPVESSTELKHHVLLAPHHGSRTSSQRNFVTAVNPEHVIISSGYLNRWQFPHPGPLANYRHVNALISNTAQVGSVSLSWDGAGNFLGTQYFIRDVQPRWYRPYE